MVDVDTRMFNKSDREKSEASKMEEEGKVEIGTKTILILACLSFASITMAAYGWWQVSFPEIGIGDAIYRGLKTVEMGEVYDHIDEEFRSKINSFPVRLIQIARWIGVFIKLSALAYIIRRLFNESFVKLKLVLRANHVVIVGNSEFSDKLVEMSRTPMVHLRSRNETILSRAHAIKLPLIMGKPNMLADASAGRAAHIIIATERDDRALDLAMVAQRQYPDVQVSLRLNDPWLAKRVHQIKGAERLCAFSDADAGAHFVIRRHPPFLLAQDRGQEALHTLLIGDYDWIESLMSEILLSSGTLKYGKPTFGLICEAPQEFSERLHQRYPEIDKAANLNFFAGHHLSHLQTSQFGLEEICELAPVTAVYVALNNRAAGLSVALAFLEVARKTPSFSAPIFMLSDSTEGLARGLPGCHLEPLELAPFGAMEDITAASGLLALETQIAEQAFHGAYLTIPGISGEAVKPWGQLKEEYRVSNRRAVGHIMAKLFEAGFDIRGWMATHDIWTQLPVLATGEELYRSQGERKRLAELEHERWLADRRLGGWSYAEHRDNLRKLHPDMKPFEQLSDAVKDYDIKFIDQLNDRILRRAPDGINRP